MQHAIRRPVLPKKKKKIAKSCAKNDRKKRLNRFGKANTSYIYLRMSHFCGLDVFP